MCSQATEHTINDSEFRNFKRQLYHVCLAAVLSTLKPGMITPVVWRCPDGHFRRISYDFGPFIADYPEQVKLVGIVQNWCATYVKFPCENRRPLTVGRCTVSANNLDAAFAGLRTNALLDTLLDEFPADILWDEDGIDVDIVVGRFYFYFSMTDPFSHLRVIFRELTFTKCSPRIFSTRS